MLIRKEKMLMRNGKKSLKKGQRTAYYLLTCSNVSGSGYHICKCREDQTEQNKAYLDPGQEIPFKGKRHKKESEMVLHKEISGNCQ